ncbi:guanylate-binding protein 4 [Trifolium medium]|uniref:Guanylate-binding protein 4 n=1 Tax=Trifolium medium TaxID=97028 RepID=A0A392LYK6_9FABA|nr:guanylate-binding protein 4 [Trifolium medium]
MMEWKRKYENLLSKQKAEDDQVSSELTILRSRSSAAEARLAAAQEQIMCLHTILLYTPFKLSVALDIELVPHEQKFV